MVDKGLVTDQLVLTVGYDIDNLKKSNSYKGEITIDRYGRRVPKSAHGSINLGKYSSSAKQIVQAAMDLFERIVDKNLLVRRLTVVANHVIAETDIPDEQSFEQLDLFTDYTEAEARREKEAAELEKEKKMQQAILSIKKKYGKNAILKGMNLEEGAPAKDRNNQIGGHKA